MAKLILFGKEVTIEEYVKGIVTKNDGVSTYIQKHVLYSYLENCEISYKKSATKEQLLNQLYEHYGNWDEVARKLEIGVKVNQYTDAFPFVTKGDIKRLEKFEVLKVVGYEMFRAYGKYKYASVYDLEQFISMTEQDMKQLITKYPKGLRKRGRT